MSIPFFVPSAEAIPQGLADYYVKKDTGFQLDADGAMSVAEHQGLQKALQAERAKSGQLDGELKKIKSATEGIEDLQSFRRDAEAAQAELAQLRDGNKDVAAKIAEAKASSDASWKQRMEQIEISHKKKVEETTAELQKLQSTMRREALKSAFASSEALKKTSFADLPLEMVLGALGPAFEIVEHNGALAVTAKDQYGNQFITTSGQPAFGEDAIKQLLDTHPDRERFRKDTGPGAGSPGGTSGVRQDLSKLSPVERLNAARRMGKTA